MTQIHTASSSILFRSRLLLLRLCLCLGIIKVSCIHTLQQGETLNSSSRLDSPNALFTLRFYTVEATDATYIAILFNQNANLSADTSPVWIGNRDEPILNSIPSLTLGARGELNITRRDGGDPIQLFAGASQLTNVTATLSDAGNFVIRSSIGNNNNQILWQSFDHPTDTLLPDMKMGVNNNISSWLSPTNPAAGAFTLEWDPTSGELVIRRRGVAYWRSGQLKDYYDEDLGNVKSFENFLFNPDPFNFNYNLTSEGENEYFMFSVIPVAGKTPDNRKVNSGWRLSSTGDIATIDDRGINMAMGSLCYGYNSGGSSNSRGCQLREQLKCRNRFQTFVERSGRFRLADNAHLVTSTDVPGSNLSLSDCREACWSWSNCECVGYTNSYPGCNYWIGKDLVWDQSKVGSLPTNFILLSSEKEKKNRIGIILGAVGAAVLLLILGLAYFIMRNLNEKREEELHDLLTLDGHEGNYEVENRGGNSHHHHLKIFSYASILSATNNFSSTNKLGEGGFGPVYKGTTAEGQDIAVKLLSRQSGQGLVEFKNELILISELQHVNLVKLLGFCVHKDEKMIVYDYMPNKSLDRFLSHSSKREQLDWKKRFNIIEGTAQGLLYLHKHSRLKIIHRDMKPNNILLDENMIPKISDFGLARIFKEDEREVNTDRRVGTYGYMAPEYAMQGIFSVKSDVYSFGVLVLEIVSGRRNSSFKKIEGPHSIVEYAWELWRKDSALQLMDPMLRDSCIIEQVQKCIQIGLLCVENQAVDRPTIEDVLSILKNETVISLPMPSNPGFITRNSVVGQVEKSSTSSNEVIKLTTNEITLSELDGR